MRHWRSFFVLLFFPLLSWGSTHIVNQSFFLNGRPDKTWSKKDTLIILGADRISFEEIARARKNFPKSMPIYWLMSDEQWYFSSIGLNKDQKVLDFASQMQEIYIQVLAENLCPQPTVLHDKNYDTIIVDSSWFLFPHQVELFKQQCSNIDVSQFYADIEAAILNAKLKPLVIVSYHSIHPSIIYSQEKNTLVGWASQIRQSLGPMNEISNPSYQRYQEKMNRMINLRPNVLFVTGNTQQFFRDTRLGVHQVDLSQKNPDHLLIDNAKTGASLTFSNHVDPVTLEFNQSYVSDNAACEKMTSSMADFNLHGGFYEFFLGSNYRKLWNKPVSIPCFDLEKEKLVINQIGGSLRSPDFELRDAQGRSFKLRPLKKEIHIPEILQDTLVEHVLLDQQSSIFPLGFILAANLSRQAGVLSESVRLVYIDSNQASFSAWREKKFPSGFYQLDNQPVNLLKDAELRKKGVIEVLSTKEMVNKLESENGYRMDQLNYLKARLFDMLIGDWDRSMDQWQWVVVQKGETKLIEPFPTDREASFYRGDGVISWWRRRKWINYKLQDYGHRLKNPDAMMVQSLSMDHRLTFTLTQKDWDTVVSDLQQRLSPEGMEKAIEALPIALSPADHQLIFNSFQQRLKELPTIAKKMRSSLIERVDIVGTPGKDVFYIQSGPDKSVLIKQYKNNEVVFTEKFDARKTKEIRIYGLDGDDDFKLNWQKHTATRVRLISGIGSDTIISRDGHMKPDVELYDDSINVDSYYGFKPYRYDPRYNEYYSQVNQRKFNLLEPVLFLASANADSGFILGGGLRYSKAGFQHAPWESTNELKANVVLNRNAANIMYQGTKFDVYGTSDFQTGVDAGLPRFYGSFFGLGNSPSALDPTKKQEYYWMRARHLEGDVKFIMPIFQYVSLTPKVQFRFRDYLIDQNSFLTTPADNQLDTKLKPGTNANMRESNYYAGTGLALNYSSDDFVSGPLKKRIIKAEAKYMFQKGLIGGDGYFQTVDVNTGLTGYFIKSKTQWKASGGYGRNFGHWEFFDAQFLGQGQNLRGFFMNRFAGASRVFGSFELNQSLLFIKSSVITDYGLGGFYDTGRVFFPNDPSEKWHKAVGGQAWITFLNSIAFKTSYAHAIFEDQKGFWSFVLTTEL